ncbi:hypothetical protein IE81DRAFT_322183 [Ceraceosorus guamensis]|uniref:Proteasome maturation factor UMP1 n=1 Tax=Ceraceosorus guamensis TaxID=1522189 RepID=A0A316W1Z1_9BASI|nr:hypothetical protein IE81DRAFT_322183 [Ceraceosorus guamensis]PWN43762.1 hypothetical protein IE81DRAFT_322183 [Ceraceosorus guamensis]
MSSQSLRLVPGPSTSSSVSLEKTSHSVHAGAHDAMRHGPRSLSHENSHAAHHPLESRLEQWNGTRDQLKLNLMRNTYGLGAPMRTMLERGCVVKDGPFPNMHASHAGTHKGLAAMQLDILNGDDETLEPSDFLPTDFAHDNSDIHALLDAKSRRS